ncbi:hypothetical protein H5202_17800 [Shewanella sp. SG41-4]|uniref:hypothetical protein n=1 Tax=Shewanella sp. SG41-4 TaxID=2760976 RepID=UPI0016027117|nr:hypothetical protein [Shewanella sp. SG41-4]MBB1440493.1 hypothetical protein [Shewanella sp. SG41-4]
MNILWEDFEMKKSAIAIALTSALLMIGSAYAEGTGDTQPTDGSSIVSGPVVAAAAITVAVIATAVNDSNEESGNNTGTGTGTTTTSTGTGTGTTTTSVTN